MREAAHGIATLLLLTGCLGMTWMGMQACLALDRLFHGDRQPVGLVAIQAQVNPRLVHERVPFVITP